MLGTRQAESQHGSSRLIGVFPVPQFHPHVRSTTGFLTSSATQRSGVKRENTALKRISTPFKVHPVHHVPQNHKNLRRSQSFISMVALTALSFGFLLRSICAQPMHPNSVEFDVPDSFPPPPRSGSCSTTICGDISEEPLGPTVRSLRASTCSATSVDTIKPGAASNPTNVRNVERILTEQLFGEFFPNKNPAYTYTNLLKAVGKFPSVCASASSCPRIIAAMLAHIQQETGGLVYTDEIQKSDYCAEWTPWVAEAYPCAKGKQYYGRGAKQLSWNYNYGAFSRAMLGDANVLLEQPELVATTWLNFASAIWFFVTPQPPKPSMLQVLDGSWRPNQQDRASGLETGFGASTMVINGGLECGPSPSNPTGAANRAMYYKSFSCRLGVDVSKEKLDCKDSRSFSSGGSAGSLGLYWAPETGCTLVSWQTAFSALVEGDYQACRQGKQTGCKPSATKVPPTQRPTQTPIQWPTQRPTQRPTRRPTQRPTKKPTTKKPTQRPTQRPTLRPTPRPTQWSIRRPIQWPIRVPSSGAANHLKRVCKKTIKGRKTLYICTFVRG